MKVNCNNTLIALLAFCIPMLCHAFMIEKGVWLIADTVTNADIYTELTKVEEAAKTQKLKEASQLLVDILQSGKADGYVASDMEPLSLTIYSASLWYKAESYHNQNQAIVKEARTAIKEWEEKAKGNQWKSYKNLFYRMRDHYIRKKDQVNRIATQKEAILYDPFDLEQISSLNEYCRRFPNCVGDMAAFAKEFKEKGGVLPAFLELTIIVAENNDKEKKLDAVLSWLWANRHESLENIKNGVETASQLISIEHPEGIKLIVSSLTDLALAQPGSEERMPVIAYLINERAKIQAISKDVLKD